MFSKKTGFCLKKNWSFPKRPLLTQWRMAIISWKEAIFQTDFLPHFKSHFAGLYSKGKKHQNVLLTLETAILRVSKLLALSSDVESICNIRQHKNCNSWDLPSVFDETKIFVAEYWAFVKTIFYCSAEFSAVSAFKVHWWAEVQNQVLSWDLSSLFLVSASINP